jgi:hypothetical protein
MQRPDWKVAGAAGLLAGLTIGGFSFVSGTGTVDRMVRSIELRGDGATATGTPGIIIGGPSDGPDAGVPEPIVSPAPDSATASLDSPVVVAPPIVTEKATPKPTPRPVLDSDDSDSADSSD